MHSRAKKKTKNDKHMQKTSKQRQNTTKTTTKGKKRQKKAIDIFAFFYFFLKIWLNNFGKIVRFPACVIISRFCSHFSTNLELRHGDVQICRDVVETLARAHIYNFTYMYAVPKYVETMRKWL